MSWELGMARIKTPVQEEERGKMDRRNERENRKWRPEGNPSSRWGKPSRKGPQGPRDERWRKSEADRWGRNGERREKEGRGEKERATAGETAREETCGKSPVSPDLDSHIASIHQSPVDIRAGDECPSRPTLRRTWY